MFVLMYAILYIFICTGSESRLVRVPVNIAVVQGSAVTLECSSDVSGSFIHWYDSLCVRGDKTDCKPNEAIYSGIALGSSVDSTRFNVTSVNNATHVTRDIIINPVQPSDASVYLCVEYVGGDVTDTSSAQLTVIGGNTRCATNLSASGAVQENDVITMTCSITYSGNWAPVMRWFNSVSGVNYQPTSANQTSSRLTLTASTGLHGSKVACLTNFTQPSSPLQTSATNIPSYTHIWTSPTLDVQFAPRNLQITPNEAVYQAGDRIQCSAEGNPAPFYQWTDLVNGDVTQGDVLDISEDMVNRSYTFQCTATNNYSSISSGLSFTVKGVESQVESGQLEQLYEAYKSATIALAVIAIISILINVLLIIYLLRKTPRKDNPVRSEDRSPATETGNTSDYSQLNMTSLNANVPYESIQPTYSEVR